MSEHYFACPERRCHAPGRAFCRALDAARWAREASEAYRVTYAVWFADDDIHLSASSEIVLLPPVSGG